jgi:hypothetical protein
MSLHFLCTDTTFYYIFVSFPYIRSHLSLFFQHCRAQKKKDLDCYYEPLSKCTLEHALATPNGSVEFSSVRRIPNLGHHKDADLDKILEPFKGPFSLYVVQRVLMSCHVMSCHVMSCHDMLCHVMIYYVMSCHVMSCHVMSCHVMLCHVMSCHVMSCHVMSCHAVSYY